MEISSRHPNACPRGEGLGRSFLAWRPWTGLPAVILQSTAHIQFSEFSFSVFKQVRPFYSISSGKYLAPSIGIKQVFDIQ